ncbi:MAG: hypothetical protein R3D80_12625 [Paracoccaceae bacterium]
MSHAICFVIEGKLRTQVRVSGNLDGTLSFEFTILGAGSAAAIEAVFLDLNRPLDGAGFSIFGDAGLSLGPCVAEGVDTLGRAATLARPAVDVLGDFDIGITFGPLRGAMPAGRRMGFTLAHAAAPLSLDMIDLADFALRHAGHGVERADAGTAAGTRPAREVLEVIEIQTVTARPLAEDPAGGTLAVVDLVDLRDRLAGFPDGVDWASGGESFPFGDDFASAAFQDRRV